MMLRVLFFVKHVALCTGLLFVICVNAQEDTGRADLEVPTIEVIGTTPLSSTGIALQDFAGNVQSLLAEDIEKSRATDLSEILIRNVGSVHINDSQNNPYQNDIFYRGFLASPLVGSAVGLSVYMDGVRLNEGFGDTINWDLIPDSAVAAINVIPGSNPLFGLNTLGGALSLRTKSGKLFQGTNIDFSGGSWGRWGGEFQHGGIHDDYDWYLAADVGEDDGWRDRSPSEIRRLFTKFGWESGRGDIDVSYIYNDNDLIGNGFAPERLLALDREAVHTFPDNTVNELHHINLQGSYAVNNSWQLSGNAFYRDYERSTLNGDAESECEDVFTDDMQEDGLAPNLCFGTAADALARLPAGSQLFDDAGAVLAGTDPLELEAEGEERTSDTDTKTYGTTVQTAFLGDWFGHDNQLTLGLDYSRIDVRFTQTEAEAELRRFGNSVGTVNPDPQEVEVDIDTEQKNIGLYFSNTTDITDDLALTLSGRWQDVDIELRDRTGEPENADLNGDHSFNRFNPAAGFTYQFVPVTFFANYSEGFRVPTAAELSCADPDDPCNLPNAFVADPPLDPVIARTIEIGARGRLSVADGLFWHLAAYRTRLHDDLLFTITETGGGGFFQNVGSTQRDGVEFGIAGEYGRLVYFANYAYVAATFESAEMLASTVEPDGVQVQSGDSLPGIPEHTFKLGAEYELLPKLWLGAHMLSASGSYLRGDESNELPKTDSYVVFNLNARAEIWNNIEIWGKLDNVFDEDYETAGARNFNANADTIFGDDIEEERFLAPGAPRAGWVGITLRF